MTTIQIRTDKTRGTAPVLIRIKDKSFDIRISVKSLRIDIDAWNRYGSKGIMEWLRKHDEPTHKKLDEIQKKLNASMTLSDFNRDKAQEIINGIVNKEAIELREKMEAEQREAEEARIRLEAENRRNKTLSVWIEEFIGRVESNKVKTEKSGLTFSKGTIKSLKQTQNVIIEFEKARGTQSRLSEIDNSYYADLIAFLADRGYQINSEGKTIKNLKYFLTKAEKDGLDVNSEYKGFKMNRIEVDNIYLTRDELDRLRNVDLTHFAKIYDISRDIFLLGCNLGQRISDYGNIKPENLQKRIVEFVDEDGKTRTEERTVFVKYQQKTGEEVSVVCNSEVMRILAKYNNRPPHVWEQHLNDHIKAICMLAQIDEMIGIKTTRGGNVKIEYHPKYELVKTHTARRTAATLLYQEGADIETLMSVTGHTNFEMLKKYLKNTSRDKTNKQAKLKFFD